MLRAAGVGGELQEGLLQPGAADLDVKEWVAANATYRTVEFNMTRPFLADKRVREALALAINRADVLDLAEPLNHFNTHASLFDAHPNEAAHRVIAEQVRRVLLRLPE